MGSSVGGLTGGIFGSSSTPSVPNVTAWQPTGTSAFDTSYQNLLNSSIANNPYTTYTPQATATFNQQYNNPYAGAYQSAADVAGAAYGQTGTNAVNSSNAINTAANATLPAATQALNMGFDPQNALYQQQNQQNQDSVNAAQAARGITNSPYGASVSNTANTNFNLDWQNNQLQRALQSLAGYDTAVGSAASNATSAENLGSAGANAINNAGAVPFAATNTIAGNQSTALNNLLSVLGNSGAGTYNNTNLSNLMQYLSLGAGQSNNQAQLSLDNYANQLKASQNASSGMGGIASSLFNMLNGGSFSANSSTGGGNGANGGAGGFGGILNSILGSSSSAGGSGAGATGSILSSSAGDTAATAGSSSLWDTILALLPNAAAAA